MGLSEYTIKVLSIPFLIWTALYFSQRLIGYSFKDGSRDNWHRSDRVYFGNSLSWRRWKNSEDLFPPTRRDLKKYCEIIAWSEFLLTTNTDQYLFEFYQSEWPRKENGIFSFDAPTKAGEYSMTAEDCIS